MHSFQLTTPVPAGQNSRSTMKLKKLATFVVALLGVGHLAQAGVAKPRLPGTVSGSDISVTSDFDSQLVSTRLVSPLVYCGKGGKCPNGASCVTWGDSNVCMVYVLPLHDSNVAEQEIIFGGKNGLPYTPPLQKPVYDCGERSICPPGDFCLAPGGVRHCGYDNSLGPNDYEEIGRDLVSVTKRAIDKITRDQSIIFCDPKTGSCPKGYVCSPTSTRVCLPSCESNVKCPIGYTCHSGCYCLYGAEKSLSPAVRTPEGPRSSINTRGSTTDIALKEPTVFCDAHKNCPHGYICAPDGKTCDHSCADHLKCPPGYKCHRSRYCFIPSHTTRSLDADNDSVIDRDVTGSPLQKCDASHPCPSGWFCKHYISDGHDLAICRPPTFAGKRSTNDIEFRQDGGHLEARDVPHQVRSDAENISEKARVLCTKKKPCSPGFKCKLFICWPEPGYSKLPPRAPTLPSGVVSRSVDTPSISRDASPQQNQTSTGDSPQKYQVFCDKKHPCPPPNKCEVWICWSPKYAEVTKRIPSLPSRITSRGDDASRIVRDVSPLKVRGSTEGISEKYRFHCDKKHPCDKTDVCWLAICWPNSTSRLRERFAELRSGLTSRNTDTSSASRDASSTSLDKRDDDVRDVTPRLDEKRGEEQNDRFCDLDEEDNGAHRVDRYPKPPCRQKRTKEEEAHLCVSGEEDAGGPRVHKYEHHCSGKRTEEEGDRTRWRHYFLDPNVPRSVEPRSEEGLNSIVARDADNADLESRDDSQVQDCTTQGCGVAQVCEPNPDGSGWVCMPTSVLERDDGGLPGSIEKRDENQVQDCTTSGCGVGQVCEPNPDGSGWVCVPTSVFERDDILLGSIEKRDESQVQDCTTQGCGAGQVCEPNPDGSGWVCVPT